MKELIIVQSQFGHIDITPLNERPTLKQLQDAVGGYIEPVYLPDLNPEGIVLLVNEEGLLQGLPPNENLYPFFFCGNVVFVGVEGEDFVGLTKKQELFLSSWLVGLWRSME